MTLLRGRPNIDAADPADGGRHDIGAGFSRKHRLLTAADFSAVFSARRVLRGACFDLHYVDRGTAEAPSSPGDARLGLVVAKKLARLAVQRNLVKRLAREIFRKLRRDLPPCDLVFRLTRLPAGHPRNPSVRTALREDMERLLSRLPRSGQAL